MKIYDSHIYLTQERKKVLNLSHEAILHCITIQSFTSNKVIQEYLHEGLNKSTPAQWKQLYSRNSSLLSANVEYNPKII